MAGRIERAGLAALGRRRWLPAAAPHWARRSSSNSTLRGSFRLGFGSVAISAERVIHLGARKGCLGIARGSPQRGAARGRRRTALTQFRPRFGSGSAAGGFYTVRPNYTGFSSGLRHSREKPGHGAVAEERRRPVHWHLRCATRPKT